MTLVTVTPALDAEAACLSGWERGSGDAELGLSGVGLLGLCVGVGGGVAEILVDLGAVGDGDVGGHLLAVAEVADGDRGADLAGGDVGDEVIAVLDLASVDGDEDVLGLESGLGCAASGDDRAYDDAAVGEAVDAADGRGGLGPGTGCRWIRGRPYARG